MVFSGILFLIYFLPIFFLGYYLVPNKHKNHWLVLASLLFYFWGAPVFIMYALFTALIDYLIAKKLSRTKNKRLLFLGILLNIGLLLYFKYFNFFTHLLNDLYEIFDIETQEWSTVILPIGISFLTFQKVSYLIDVYRGDCSPQTKFRNYLLFIFLFPQLIAGPIVRYKDIKNQLTHRIYFNLDQVYQGFFRFTIGLSKKVIIANPLGFYADEKFNLDLSEMDSSTAVLLMLTYTFQIYFDFSGYSDMAIGLGKMLGFKLPENFNFPYISKSITEFWRRWHITLGNWMKDYLYIPLGGNKNGNAAMYRNLILVFTISGFWHGAGLNFIFWGLFHGVFLVLERLVLLRVLLKFKFVSIIYSFIIVSIGWVFFRVTEFSDGVDLLASVLKCDFDIPDISKRVISMLLLAFFFSFVGVRFENELTQFQDNLTSRNIWFKTLICLALLILCLAELFASSFNPFIYFKF